MLDGMAATNRLQQVLYEKSFQLKLTMKFTTQHVLC